MDVIANKTDAVYAHQLAIVADKVLNLLDIKKSERPQFLSLFMGWSKPESMPTDAITKIKVDTCLRLAHRFSNTSWWQWDAVLKEEIQMFALKLMMTSNQGSPRAAVSKATAAMRNSAQTVSLPVPAVKE